MYVLSLKSSWKVINVYLEEDQGREKVKVRRYKCPGKGVGRFVILGQLVMPI